MLKRHKCVGVMGWLFGHKFIKSSGGTIYDWSYCFRCGGHAG